MFPMWSINRLVDIFIFPSACGFQVRRLYCTLPVVQTKNFFYFGLYFHLVLLHSGHWCDQPEQYQTTQHPKVPNPCGWVALCEQLYKKRSCSAFGWLQAGHFLFYISIFFFSPHTRARPNPMSGYCSYMFIFPNKNSITAWVKKVFTWILLIDSF